MIRGSIEYSRWVAEKQSGSQDLTIREQVMSLSNALMIPGLDRVALVPPTGLGFDSGIIFYNNGTTSFNKESYKLPATAEIWISPTGNDSTGNGTSGSPWRSFTKAFDEATALADAIVTIYVQAGLYSRQISWSTSAGTKDLNVIAVGGKAIVSKRYEALSWAVHSGNCYVATRSAVDHVRDQSLADSDNFTPKLILAADAAGCVSTPGSYFISGSTLYVHLFDGRAPDDDVLVMGALGSAGNTVEKSYYIEGLEFEGGTGGAFFANATTPTNAIMTCVNCDFRYSVGNGLRHVGVPRINSVNCRAYGNDQDGFNYQQGAGDPRMVEINCRGFRNGVADNNDNGSSLHGSCRGIRFYGEHFLNRGPNVVDIDSAKSWNYRVTARDSTSTGTKTAFLTSSASTANEMWLERCVANDTTAINAAGSSTIFTRANTVTGTVTGNVVPF
jgi:hypothetical protein